jgi:hypothetical protein
MSAHRAFAQEFLFATVLDQLHKQGIPKGASEELRADRLYQLLELYEACVILETKVASGAGRDAEAILRKARETCATARIDLNVYTQGHLSAALRTALLEEADDEARTMATAELEVAGLSAASSPND